MPPAEGTAACGAPDAARVRRRRDKLEPDPAVRRRVLAAATDIIRAEGISGLNIAGVLDRCNLGTRAFYRNFSSKDELLAAVFLDIARAEASRLRSRMRTAPTAVDAVAAWIDGRLDLAFDPSVTSDLRQLSEEAQSLMFTSPRLVQSAFAEMLTPLVEQLELGLAAGVFVDIDPGTDAQLIQGAVWACTERQWVSGETPLGEIRNHVLRSCLRGLGVAPRAIASVLAARPARRT